MKVENAVKESGRKAIPQQSLHDANENTRNVRRAALRTEIQTHTALNNMQELYLRVM
jgi:hypothetical protein